jgi:hypothetical protein
MSAPNLRLMIMSCCLAAASVFGMTACKKDSDPDQSQASDAAAIRDMKSSENIGGDRFKVICKNGDRETRTADQMADQEVCNGYSPPVEVPRPYPGRDPRGPAKCMTKAQAAFFTVAERVELCEGAIDEGPALCAIEARTPGTPNIVAVRICKPQTRYPEPYPPGHGGYPRPFPYN